MDKKKYKYLIIALIVLVIIIDIVLFYFAFLKKDTLKMKEYKNTDYSFQYRSDYEVKEISKEKISLGSNNKTGEINIVVTKIDDEALKRDKMFIIDEAQKEFSNNNENYLMNYSGSYNVNDYTVYDYLFDDEERQIDLNYILKDDKLILISYVNDNEYFDLYEERVLDIINSLKIT